MSKGFRVACGVMALLFVAWAYFQLNDLDYEPWVAMYAASALMAGAAALGRLPYAAPLGLAAFVALWALLVVPEALGRNFSSFFEEIEGELWRESFGLSVAAVWNAFLGWRLARFNRHRRREKTAHS